ncbi:MAG: response regulator transcription factor [Acidobacteriota bacterium]
MRLLIVDDHALFRDSLRGLLTARGIDVVGEASDGARAIALADRLQPDLVLMDLAMPGMDGLEATRRLRAEHPSIKIVILTASHDDDDLFEAIKAGAEGYLLKDLEAERFFSLLDGVARGEPALTPMLARKLIRAFQAPQADADEPIAGDDLTQRERDVLRAMVDGVTSNRALARHLGLSENTVKFHVRNILDKLHLRDRAQAVGYALRSGLVSSDAPADA